MRKCMSLSQKNKGKNEMKKHILGFPRIGVQRELKRVLESYWKGNSTESELFDCCKSLRLKHWNIQRDAGLSVVAVGDFSMYDLMLDTSLMLCSRPRPTSTHASRSSAEPPPLLRLRSTWAHHPSRRRLRSRSPYLKGALL